MGIPKFFRYIAQRWPLSSQSVNDNVIPEFDNLYLDMNSIIHMCTHANADNVGHLDDDKVYRQISNYIEHLFTVINPQKVFFMAIDGVAPRAKMNQQRSRRFRSALDAENQRRKAAQEGIPLDEDPFDSSSITPGTEFMAKITVQLKYFIARKITEDSRWQNCRIILSGHEVPGEGEHKIMRFIRHAKSQPDYDPNTRHCLYGLDADLIMLGLSTHEPHFSLLREEVTFGRKVQFQSTELSEQKFILLHLSLVRDYLDLELSAGDFEEKPDFERQLDDFILIMFFIGNDFLPELPMLLVNEGAIPVIFDTYKKYLRHSNNAYLSKNGKVDFIALKHWMEFMKQYQTDKFEEQTHVSGWYANEMENLQSPNDEEVVLSMNQADIFQDIKRFMRKTLQKENEEATMEVPIEQNFVKLLADQTGFSYENNVLKLDKGKVPVPEALRVLRIYDTARVHNPQRAEEYGEKLINWKNRYYNRKFGDSYDSEVVKHAAYKVLEGLQWVLDYYYRDTPSWSWYYDNHYAPMITELISAIGDGFEPKFEVGTPFKPFEQLMSVLPDRSVNLIPPALRHLVLDDNSPIKDFYPHSFELDKNGKKADWEAVVLIPFIDEQRLLKYVRPIEENGVTEAEKFRNSQGVELEFFYDPNEYYEYKSPLRTFPDIEGCTSVTRPLVMPKHEFRYGRLPGSYSGKSALAGFPSLHTLDFDWDLESGQGVKVFEMPSRDDSVIIKVKPASQRIKANQTVYVNWPFLHEARVTKVRAPDGSPVWSKVIPRLDGDLKRVGVQMGKTQALIGCHLLQGLVRNEHGAYVKDFDGPEIYIPAQLVVTEVAHEDPRFKERAAVPIAEEFPVNSTVLLLLAKFYGFPAQVVGHSDNFAEVEVTAPRYRDPMFNVGKTAVINESRSIRWWPLSNAAKSLDVSVKFLLNVTSRMMVDVDGKDVNVALPLRKHGLGLIAEGYSRMNYRKEWEFSDRGLALIISFLKLFGGPIGKASRSLKAKLDADTYTKIRTWLQEHTREIRFIPSSTNHLTQKTTRFLEQQLISLKPTVLEKVVLKHVEKGALLSPTDAYNQLRAQHFRLGDRVVSALDHGKVPLFARGIVIGINTGKTSQSTTLDVVWDHEFAAGSHLDDRLATNRGLTVPAQSVLNLSQSQMEYHHSSSNVAPRVKAAVDTRDTPATRPKNSKSNDEKKSRYAPAIPHNDWAEKRSKESAAPAAPAAPAPAAAVAPPAAAPPAAAPAAPTAAVEALNLNAASSGTSTKKQPSPKARAESTVKDEKLPKGPKAKKEKGRKPAQGSHGAKQSHKTAPKQARSGSAEPTAPKQKNEPSKEDTKPEAPKPGTEELPKITPRRDPGAAKTLLSILSGGSD